MLSVKPVGRGKIYANIVEQLENEILQGNKLNIGDQLPSEAELAQMFHVGKRSVRDALQVLETKGLIERRHGERAHVIRNDIGFFMESLSKTVQQLIHENKAYFLQLMQVRRIIEVEVAGLVAESTEPGRLTDMEDALRTLKIAMKEDKNEFLAKGDADFHHALVKALNNEILTVFYNNLYELIRKEIEATIPVHGKEIGAGYEEHYKIYNLLKNNDIDGAKKELSNHIQGSMNFLRLVLESTEVD